MACRARVRRISESYLIYQIYLCRGARDIPAFLRVKVHKSLQASFDPEAEKPAPAKVRDAEARELAVFFTILFFFSSVTCSLVAFKFSKSLNSQKRRTARSPFHAAAAQVFFSDIYCYSKC